MELLNELARKRLSAKYATAHAWEGLGQKPWAHYLHIMDMGKTAHFLG